MSVAEGFQDAGGEPIGSELFLGPGNPGFTPSLIARIVHLDLMPLVKRR